MSEPTTPRFQLPSIRRTRGEERLAPPGPDTPREKRTSSAPLLAQSSRSSPSMLDRFAAGSSVFGKPPSPVNHSWPETGVLRVGRVSRRSRHKSTSPMVQREWYQDATSEGASGNSYPSPNGAGDPTSEYWQEYSYGNGGTRHGLPSPPVARTSPGQVLLPKTATAPPPPTAPKDIAGPHHRPRRTSHEIIASVKHAAAAVELLQAITSNDKIAVHKILEAAPDLLVRFPYIEGGITPMHAAVICGHTEIAVELQRLGADPYQEDDSGVSAVDLVRDMASEARAIATPTVVVRAGLDDLKLFAGPGTKTAFHG